MKLICLWALLQRLNERVDLFDYHWYQQTHDDHLQTMHNPALRLSSHPCQYLVPYRHEFLIRSDGFFLIFSNSVLLLLCLQFLNDYRLRDHEVDRSQSIAPQTGKKLDRLIMLMLALGLGYFAFDKFVLDPSRDIARELIISQQARSEALVERYGDKSIAVLPFVNMSSDPEQEYFSDGISEELLNLLAKIPELRVISRSSAFSFKGKDLDIPTVASQLQVSHVLEGSVRKAGNKVRITVQLIDARTDTHLWSQTYDRELDDIFAIQDEISGKVVEQLRLTLLEAAPQARKTDPEAFNLFLQGRFFLDQFTQESLEKASEFYQGALDIDPEYPPALKGLAEVYANRAAQGLLPLQESVETAWRLVRKSAELDPYYADAWAGIGSMYQYYEHDLNAAAHSFERAVQLGPNQGSIDSNHHAIQSRFWMDSTASRIFKSFSQPSSTLRQA